MSLSLLIGATGNASTIIQQQAAAACGNSCGNASLTVTFNGVANLLIFLVGSVSVIMIIIGGLRYVISNGDQKQIESAKNTILYAVIGIVVAIASYAIVNFVATHIT
jgi:hypothetical protein